MERTRFTPAKGTHYMNRNGVEYVCLRVSIFDGNAIMQSVTSKWTFTAVGCGQYEDGTIDWDMSISGYFDNEDRPK